MRKKPDPDQPHGRLTRAPDFLPPPEALAVPRDELKVTLSLSRRSVDFFKRQARMRGTKYQRMIRELVDLYAARHEGR